MLFCFALGASARTISRTDTMSEVAQASKLHVDERRHCEGVMPIAARPADCVWRVADSQGAIWLVGDSNAGHFTEPVVAAANRAGYEAYVATSAGCSFADLVLVQAHNPLDGCRRFVAQTAAALATLKPALVVLANDATMYIGSGEFQFRDPATGATASTPAAKARMWATALSSTLHRFAAAGVPVLVVDTVPHFGDWDLAQCPAIRIYLDLKSCGTSSTLNSIRVQQYPGLVATKTAMKGLTNVTEVDFTEDLCSAITSATNRGSEFLYRDFSHLTIKAALTLTPKFTEVMRQAIAAG